MIKSLRGKSPNFGKHCYIDETAYVCGDVTTGENCMICPYASIRGDINSITIGNNSNVQEFASLHTRTDNRLCIGNNVVIGHGAILHGCTIQDNCIIGSGAIIMDGVTVESGCIIGAGTVVAGKKTIAANQVVIGNPFRLLRMATEADKKEIALNVKEYVNLIDDYLEEK